MRTLRARLALAFTAAALLAAGLTAGGTALLLTRADTTRALDVIERQADVLAATVTNAGTPASPPRIFLLRNNRTRALGANSPLARAVSAHLPGHGRQRGSVSVGRSHRQFLYVQVPTGGAPVLLARSAKGAAPSLAPFVKALAISALVAMVLALGLASALAARLTRPLRRLSLAIRRVHAGEAGATVPVQTSDEVGELASAFNDLSVELAHAREAQRQFLASASHELKTPITALHAQGEALSTGALDPQVAGPHIVRETERLQRLVGDLLTLAELERPAFPIDNAPIDLVAVADATVARHRAQAAALEIALTRPPGGPAGARGDTGRLEQVLSNLVENALRVVPAGGRITIRVAPGELTVVDDGPGLAPEELPRAFERFFLYERHRSDRQVGSGLGLSLVAELMEAMGGHAEVQSEPGHGASFRLVLRPA